MLRIFILNDFLYLILTKIKVKATKRMKKYAINNPFVGALLGKFLLLPRIFPKWFTQGIAAKTCG